MADAPDIVIKVAKDSLALKSPWYVVVGTRNVRGIDYTALPGHFSKRWMAAELCRALAEAYRNDNYNVTLEISSRESTNGKEKRKK